MTPEQKQIEIRKMKEAIWSILILSGILIGLVYLTGCNSPFKPFADHMPGKTASILKLVNSDMKCEWLKNPVKKCENEEIVCFEYIGEPVKCQWKEKNAAGN